MLCRRCMTIMKSGTTYEQKKGGGYLHKRFHECRECHNRIYTKEPNFQEYLNNELKKK